MATDRKPGALTVPDRIGRHVISEGVLLLLLAGWWYTAHPAILPRPDMVLLRMGELFVSPDPLEHVLVSLVRIVLSVILATVLGIALAMLGHYVPLFSRIVFTRILPFLNAMPSVGWALFGITWFGANHTTVIFVIVMILTPFTLVNVAAGLRELDGEAIEMARSFTRSRRKVFLKMTLPLMMPYIMGALRIGYGVGWKVGLVAELFGGESGVGYLIQFAQTTGDNVTVFAACLIIVLLFWAGEKLVLNPLARRYQRS